jgi:putative tricarboxylic transport membrane protein
MTKRLMEFLILSAFLIIAVLLYCSTASYPAMVQGSTARYVRFLGVMLGLLCSLELFFLLKKKKQEGGTEKLVMGSKPLLFWGLFIILLVYAVLLTPLGFYLSSALFLPASMLLLGARKPLTISLSTAGVLLFVYLVFALLLEVPLPESTLF